MSYTSTNFRRSPQKLQKNAPQAALNFKNAKMESPVNMVRPKLDNLSLQGAWANSPVTSSNQSKKIAKRRVLANKRVSKSQQSENNSMRMQARSNTPSHLSVQRQSRQLQKNDESLRISTSTFSVGGRNLMHHRVPERADDGIESIRASSMSSSCSSFNSSMLQSVESGSKRYLSGKKAVPSSF